jgi:hypothetical protein
MEPRIIVLTDSHAVARNARAIEVMNTVQAFV